VAERLKATVSKMYNSGMRQIDIVRHFNCSKSTISMIINSKNKE